MYELKRLISRHMEENIFKYFFVLCVFAAGIVFGFLFSGNVSEEVSKSLTEEISNFLDGFSVGTVDKTKVFKTAFFKDIRFLILILISGFSVWLLPICWGTILSFGFSIGFTVTYMASNFGGTGLSVALVSLIFTFLINIPVYVILAVVAFNNGKLKRSNHGDGGLGTYIGIFIFFFVISMIGVVADSFVIPSIIKLICS